LSIAYDNKFFDLKEQFTMIDSFSIGTLVEITKDVFMWCGETVNRGGIKTVSCGMKGVIVDSSGVENGFHEHCNVLFESGDMGFVPARWLVAI